MCQLYPLTLTFLSPTVFPGRKVSEILIKYLFLIETLPFKVCTIFHKFIVNVFSINTDFKALEMRTGILLFVLFTFFAPLSSQNLTVYDLQNLCSKSSWNTVNSIITKKGWEYYDSEKGNSYQYDIITWSYKKSAYDDSAQGWFYLFAFNGEPSKISYSVFNKPSFAAIENSLIKAGYEIVGNEIEDNEIITTYQNSKFYLEVTTAKTNDDFYTNRSITAYNITLKKKGGAYDKKNGKKYDYYYGDVVENEYTLKNGMIDGPIKSYYQNGNLKKTGFYIKGIASGKFQEFNESGELTAEYYMENDELNGPYTTYFQGKKAISLNFQNGKENGPYEEKIYNDKTGALAMKFLGAYHNGEKDGKWLIQVNDEGEIRNFTFETYSEGMLHGPFQNMKGDSLVIGSYTNGKLEGPYAIYRDFQKMLFGGFISTDTSKLFLIEKGNYYQGGKSGTWKSYDLTGSLISEGRYFDDLKNGSWKYYFSKINNWKGETQPFSNKLYLVETYDKGVLDGRSMRYYAVEEKRIPCNEYYEDKNPLDTCTYRKYSKIKVTMYYKDDVLHGPYEYRDSLGNLITQGNFVNDKSHGLWVERITELGENNEPFYLWEKGKYFLGVRNGKWIKYFEEGVPYLSYNYVNGKLEGEFIEYYPNGTYKNKKIFKNNHLVEVATYDSLGQHEVRNLKIYDDEARSFRLTATEYYPPLKVVQEFLWKKEKPNQEIAPEFVDFFYLLGTGKLELENDYKYSQIIKDGKYRILDENDRIIISGQFKNDLQEGLWQFYYFDQNVRAERNFINNKPQDEIYYNIEKGELYSGEFIYTDNEKELKREIKIKNGLRHGKTVYIDMKTGEVKKKEKYKKGILQE